MVRRGDGGKGKDSGVSENRDWEVAPPYTAPAWIDTDLDELVDAEPAEVDVPAAAGQVIDEEVVASHVELAMMNLQHHQVRAAQDQEDPLHRFGSDDEMLYAIEDGAKRIMIGRGVGRDSEGCIYCLVGTSSPALLVMLDTGEMAPSEAFDGAAELTLCSVFQADHTPRRHFRLTALNQQVSNVVLVQHYKGIEDVPVEYRPGQPFLQFTDE